MNRKLIQFENNFAVCKLHDVLAFLEFMSKNVLCRLQMRLSKKSVSVKRFSLLFWSAFSGIQMRENTDQNNSEVNFFFIEETSWLYFHSLFLCFLFVCENGTQY